MALGGRAVVELDDVGAVLAGPGARSQCPDTGPDDDAVRLERGAQDLGIARVVGRRQARPGLDDRGRHAEAGIDLGQLAAGRAATEDDQAPWQLAGQGRLLVGPRRDLVETLDRRPLRDRPHGDDDVGPGQIVGDVVVADGDPAPFHDRGGPAIDDGADRGQCLDVAGVVRLGCVGRAVDHEVAVGRGARPLEGGRVGVMPCRVREQRLRRQAADVRATAAEPAAIDDGDRGPEVPGLVRGGLAGRSRTDDHEIVRVHGHSFRSGGGRPRCRRAS